MKTSVNDVFKGNNSINGLTFCKIKECDTANLSHPYSADC